MKANAHNNEPETGMGKQINYSLSVIYKAVRRKSRWLLHLTALFVSSCCLVLTGCIMFSTWENDFSLMAENPISDLVKNNVIGDTSIIDKEKFTNEANLLFLGMQEKNLKSLFKGNEDNCNDLSSGLSENKIIKCQAKIWWNLNNNGYPYFGLIKNYNQYIHPGVNLIFMFSLNKINKIYRFEVNVSDITIYDTTH